MTDVVMVWAWLAGDRLMRRLADGETRPAGVPETAWLAEQDAQAWREEIAAELAAIDLRSVRALREGNTARIAELEGQAEALREVLRVLP